MGLAPRRHNKKQKSLNPRSRLSPNPLSLCHRNSAGKSRKKSHLSRAQHKKPCSVGASLLPSFLARTLTGWLRVRPAGPGRPLVGSSERSGAQGEREASTDASLS